MAVFEGAGVAIVTPMYADGSVNYDKLQEIIEDQIAKKTDSIVICGTTGEASTLTHEEHIDVIRACVKYVKGRVPVVAGTGSNCTETAIYLSQEAEKAGADALLVVTPYYNKATQNGLFAHYSAVADVSEKPVIMYNVPSRTGCNLAPDTVARLAEHPQIVGLKEASGNMAQVAEIFAKCGDKLDIYSGEDGITVPMLAMGGKGCISVLSNVTPKLAVEMTDRFFTGDVAGAAQLQCKLLPLINALFSEVNPIPAKAAVAAMGFGQEYLRMPLSYMEPENRKRLLQHMQQLGVLA